MTPERLIALMLDYGRARNAEHEIGERLEVLVDLNADDTPEAVSLRSHLEDASAATLGALNRLTTAARYMARVEDRAPGAVEATRVLASEIAANDARSEMRVVGVTRSGAVVIGRRGGR